MSSQQSCCSIASHASSIPCDLIENQDEWFSREIDSVDKIYFGNIEEHEVEEEQGNTDESDPDESDCDSVDIQSTASENESACDRDFNVYRDEDRTEINKQNQFFAEICGCYRLHSKPCSTLISRETILEFRDYCCELDRDELDLVLKTELFSHRNKKSLKRSRDQYKSRERIHQEYYFNGHQVCRATFLFVHGIGKKRLEAVTKSLDTVGLQPRIHRNKGKAPKHALTLQQVQQVRQFLRQYAFQYGVSLPGRLPNHSNLKVTLLPSDRTKADIHSEYIKAATESSHRIISLSEFKKVWLEQCPAIVVMKPSTDLCSSCQNYNVNLTKSGNLDEEQKSELVARYQRHLEKAKLQRDYFRDQCSETKENFSSMPEEYKCRGQQPLSYQGTMHYSFDYAQQVHYPHYAQQVGPLFFKTPRKCQCFGICSEGSGTQIFYLIDESEEVGKGANSVVSMLHHHFHYKSYGETAAKLHMDNCAGQNKNNIVIWYGLWRILNNLHKEIEFSCMEAGHTKFHPDWHFGLWKLKWRTSNAETLLEIANTVSASSRNGHNISQLINDPQCPVVFYDWKKHLKMFFKPLKELSKYHHFRMHSDSPGCVFVREYASDCEVKVNLFKKCISPQSISLPSVLVPSGLDPVRQWYLYQEIRPYCHSNKDITCPKPTVPKSENKTEKVACV